MFVVSVKFESSSIEQHCAELDLENVAVSGSDEEDDEKEEQTEINYPVDDDQNKV